MKIDPIGQRLLILKCGGNEVDHSLMYKNLSIFMRTILEILVVLFQKKEGLFVLILLLLHK